MSGCCEQDCVTEVLREKQAGTLKVVLAVNAIMFVVIVVAAQVAKSSALFADSVDNLGDALTYGLSLMGVASGASAKISRGQNIKGSDSNGTYISFVR